MAGRVTRFSCTPRPDAPDDPYVSAVESTLSGITRYSYLSSTNNHVKRVSPTGQETILKDLDGKTAGVTDPLGGQKSIEYVNGLPTRVSNANKRTSASFRYDARGNVTNYTDRLSGSYGLVYDAQDRLVQQVLPDRSKWQYGIY